MVHWARTVAFAGTWAYASRWVLVGAVLRLPGVSWVAQGVADGAGFGKRELDVCGVESTEVLD